ncbi:TonB-dependent receptor [Denitratimonas sp. CY0512]|uniref:TonB-dependent receptor family protein n=1 Tax=Denitratimonas sp. CY0512 TaxID=3131940 RepID=UPI0030B2F158
MRPHETRVSLIATRFGTVAALGLWALCGVASGAPPAPAPEHEAVHDEAARLPDIVVSATRTPRDAMQLPASINAVAIDALRTARPMTALSDVLGGVPGVNVRNRQNHAQDEQISIRGFGARSTFGVRGLRLYADGIPATMPDGSGQVSHFNLDAAERIEVLRGPFSALYGNSSGGVIALHSRQGEGPARWSTSWRSGSEGFWRASVLGLGQAGAMGYNLALSRFATDGYRHHSRARRDSGNLRLDWDFGGSRQLTLVANAIDMPGTLDPLGLGWDQVIENPRQAVANAIAFNTRKSVRQRQGGLILRQDIGERHSLHVTGYGGARQVLQFLAIPAAPQNSPLHSGGVVDLDSDYHGGDLRWQYDGLLAGRALTLVAGLSAEHQYQRRRGHDNHVDGIPGLQGRLRRDERNRADSSDQYLQLDWQLADHWSLLAGARHSQLSFRSQDRYITAANPDDSGQAHYSATTPVAGLMLHTSDALKFHIAYGRGFETPTFAELAYRRDGGAGLAFDLSAARSRSLELGAKWRPSPGIGIQGALFRADTDDELAVAANSGGRSSYRNVAAARRQGLELALDAELARDWSWQLAYTRIQAQFRTDFLACSGSPCTNPDLPIAAGSPIPGVPRSQLASRLAFDNGRWQSALDASRTGVVVVNDAASQSAPACHTVGIEAGHRIGRLRLSARIDNLLDRACIGSVIVNDGNGRYFEPAPGRQWLLAGHWHF